MAILVLDHGPWSNLLSFVESIADELAIYVCSRGHLSHHRAARNEHVTLAGALNSFQDWLSSENALEEDACEAHLGALDEPIEHEWRD